MLLFVVYRCLLSLFCVVVRRLWLSFNGNLSVAAIYSWFDKALVGRCLLSFAVACCLVCVVRCCLFGCCVGLSFVVLVVVVVCLV